MLTLVVIAQFHPISTRQVLTHNQSGSCLTHTTLGVGHGHCDWFPSTLDQSHLSNRRPTDCRLDPGLASRTRHNPRRVGWAPFAPSLVQRSIEAIGRYGKFVEPQSSTARGRTWRIKLHNGLPLVCNAPRAESPLVDKFLSFR